MTTSDVLCPICNSKAKPLDKTGDAEGVNCPQHGLFKVAGSVFALARTRTRTAAEWEKALTRAKQRKNRENGRLSGAKILTSRRQTCGGGRKRATRWA
jgi:hypothetical protein